MYQIMYKSSLERSSIWLHAICLIVDCDKFKIYCIKFAVAVFKTLCRKYYATRLCPKPYAIHFKFMKFNNTFIDCYEM